MIQMEIMIKLMQQNRKVVFLKIYSKHVLGLTMIVFSKQYCRTYYRECVWNTDMNGLSQSLNFIYLPDKS